MSQNNESGRGIVYLRRSSSKQEKSLADQLTWAIEEARTRRIQLRATADTLAKAENEGLAKIGDLYLDNAITGGDMNRPGFLAFVERAKTDSEITHCFFWARDRFARPEQVEQAVGLEKSILLSGKSTITSGTCFGPRTRFSECQGEDLQMYIEYSSAGRYRANLAKMVLRGMQKNALDGYSCGGRPPYGFVRALVSVNTGEIREILPEGRRVKEEGFRTVMIPGDDEESRKRLAIVRRIANDYYNDIGGLKAIAHTLNEEGVPSPTAGTMWRGKPATGLWTESSIRTVLEQPLYMAEVCWGRRSEGSLYRHAPDAPGGYRETRESEIDAQGYGRKVVTRDYEMWKSVAPAHAYEPIVSREIWLANHEKLRGRAVKTRGVKKGTCSNKYPLEVICGQCGVPMTGTQVDGQARYKCVTYHKSGGKKCGHNWVERDAAVWFAIHAIKQKIEKAGTKKALAQAVLEMLEVKKVLVRGANHNLEQLRDKANQALHNAKQAYKDRQDAKNEVEKDIAELAYQERRSEAKALQKQVDTLAKQKALRNIDVEEEAGKALDLLNDLYGFLQHIPENRLREAFSCLGASITVEFERRKVDSRSQRASVPVSATLTLGKDKEISLPEGIKKHAVPGREDGVLHKDGRGERI